MDILFLLIPLSVLLVMAILGLFGWALFGGQFDNLDKEGERILKHPDDPPGGKDPEAVSPPVDGDQVALEGSPEQSLRNQTGV